MLRILAVVLVALLVLTDHGDAYRGSGRDRGSRSHHGRRHKVSGWKAFLESVMGKSNQRYGFDINKDNDRLFGLDFGWNYGGQSWWNGPHICKSKTVDETNATTGVISRHVIFHSRVCDDAITAYKCTTRSIMMGKEQITTEVYECCHGYSREMEEFGCPRKRAVKGMVDMARSIGLNEFLRATDSVALTDELKTGNFTIFAPVDSAFKDIDNLFSSDVLMQDMGKVIMVSEPVSNKAVTHMKNLLLGHLAVGTLKVSNLQNEQLVETGSPFKAKIRINFYDVPKKLMTANCVPVVSADHIATNGVIHKVSSILQPVTGSIIDYITKSQDLGYMKTALARANMVKTLQAAGQYTLFAPTDAAFRKLDKDVLQKLLKGDQECLQNILKNHLLPSVICSDAIQGKVRSQNLLLSFVNLIRQEDDKVFVDGAQLVHKDIVTENGVIHMIDTVLIPAEALPVSEHLEREGLSTLIQFLNMSRLLGEVKKSSNITIFAPINQAFKNLPDKVYLKLKKDPEYLKKVLLYHIVPQSLTLRNLYNNYQLPTKVKGKNIRLNEYSLFPYHGMWTQTAQCATLKKQNIESCNAIINIVDKVMLPPEGNVVDVLALDKQFTIFVGLLKRVGLADYLQGEGPFTVFAPNNKAFKSISNRTMEMLMLDEDKLKNILQNHLAGDSLCCAGIFESGWYGSPHLKTLSGGMFKLQRRGQEIKVGPSKVTECDRTATNGVVHVVDQVLVDTLSIWSRLFGRQNRRHHGRRGYRRGMWDFA